MSGWVQVELTNCFNMKRQLFRTSLCFRAMNYIMHWQTTAIGRGILRLFLDAFRKINIMNGILVHITMLCRLLLDGQMFTDGRESWAWKVNVAYLKSVSSILLGKNISCK